MATPSRAIVRAQRPTDQMIISGDIDPVVARLKLMIVGGKNLTDPECKALAAYSIATGLNPFEGECFYLPNVGPGPGIAAYRRRGSEQLWFEAERADVKGENVYFWFDHIPLTEETPFFHPSKGDIGTRAVLHDSLTKQAWEGRILKHMITLSKHFPASDSLAAAKELVGPEPTWSAEAIVYGDETFAAPGKHDRWDRNERCEKRAEKWALKKRFNLNIPEPIGFEGDVIEAEVTDVTERRSATEIMGKLGYGSEPARQAPPTNGGARPYLPEVLRQKLGDHAARLTGTPANDMLRKVIASVLDTILDGDEEKRHALLIYLTGNPSTKEISNGMVLAIAKWLDVESFGDVPNQDSTQEAKGAYVAALMNQGQLELTIPDEQLP